MLRVLMGKSPFTSGCHPKYSMDTQGLILLIDKRGSQDFVFHAISGPLE